MKLLISNKNQKIQTEVELGIGKPLACYRPGGRKPDKRGFLLFIKIFGFSHPV